MVVISQFFIDTVHNPFTCKCLIPSFMTVIFGAIQTLIQHLLIVDSIITLCCKNNIKYYPRLGSQDGFTFIILSPGGLGIFPIKTFSHVFRSKLDHQHSQLIVN